MQFKTIVLILICLIAHAENAFADFTKMPWPMFQHDASHTGYVNVDIDPAFFQLGWQVKAGETNKDYTGIVVSGDMIYLNVPNVALQGRSIEDGHIVWQNAYSFSQTVGGVLAPTVARNRVYVQLQHELGRFSPDAKLYSYNAVTGELLNLTKVAAEEFYSFQLDKPYFSPTVFADHVYIGVTYKQGFDSYKYGIAAIQTDTGYEVWSNDDSSSPSYGTSDPDFWTPTVNQKYAIVYTFQQLNVYDRLTGKMLLKYQFPFVANKNKKNYPYSRRGFAPVLLDDAKVLLLFENYLYCFDIEKKSIDWSTPAEDSMQPAYDGHTIYATAEEGRRLVAIDKQNGKILWTWLNTDDHNSDTRPVVVSKNLIFLSTKTHVYAISKLTHQPVWSYPVGGQIILGMGHLYVYNIEDNILSSFDVRELK